MDKSQVMTLALALLPCLGSMLVVFSLIASDREQKLVQAAAVVLVCAALAAIAVAVWQTL